MRGTLFFKSPAFFFPHVSYDLDPDTPQAKLPGYLLDIIGKGFDDGKTLGHSTRECSVVSGRSLEWQVIERLS